MMTAESGQPSVRFSRADQRQALLVLLIMSAVTLLNVLWFTPFSGRSLMGDDLDLLIQSRTPGGYASDFFESFTQTAADKFRPVITVLLSVVTDLFGGNFRSYRAVALALQIGNVGLVGLVGWKLSRRSWPVTVAAMILVTVSRFNVYFVLQVFGLMEGLAVTFLLLMILAVHHAFETGSRRGLAAANLCYLLAVFTHERFIVLGAFLVVAALVAPVSFRSVRKRTAWAVFPVGIALLNVVTKAVLGIDFFTGPGGQDVTFGPSQIMIFMGRALLNILGFNSGPDYLAGRNMHSLGALGIWLGIMFALAVGLVGFLVLRQWMRDRATRDPDLRGVTRALLLGASLLVPLLLSASITFRQEYRWLYAPYIALIAGVCWAVGRLPARSRLQVLAGVAVLGAGLTVDGYYRGHVENTYFFGGLRTVDSVRDDIIDRHRSELSSSTIFVVTHGDQVLEGWYLRGGGFFQVYAPASDVRLVDSLESARAARSVRSKTFAFEIQAEGVVDISAQLSGKNAETGTSGIQ